MEIARALRSEEPVISPHVRDSDARPALGMLTAAGPRAASAPGEYALLFECVREGYLLHYGEPRLVVGADPDLELLAGDYLYARGLERLASLGDSAAVRELADLISLSAQVEAHDRSPESAISSLWVAAAVAVGVGSSDEHERAKQMVREMDGEAPARLVAAAHDAAVRAGIGPELRLAAQTVGLQPPGGLELG
jgi:hypothetical protein